MLSWYRELLREKAKYTVLSYIGNIISGDRQSRSFSLSLTTGRLWMLVKRSLLATRTFSISVTKRRAAKTVYAGNLDREAFLRWLSAEWKRCTASSVTTHPSIHPSSPLKQLVYKSPANCDSRMKFKAAAGQRPVPLHLSILMAERSSMEIDSERN